MADGQHKRIDILGLPLDPVDIPTAVEFCRSAWSEKKRIRIVTINPVIIESALRDSSVADLVKSADLVVADGVGVIWAARRIHGLEIPHVPGIDLAIALIEECVNLRKPVFLLGGKESVAADAAEELAGERTELKIIGTHHGYFDSASEAGVVEMVNSSAAQLVLCGMGFPRQEEILVKIIDAGIPPPCFDGSLACDISEKPGSGDSPPIPPMVAMGVGGSLDVFAGNVTRVPEFWRKLRLEWLGRIFAEPGKRIAVIPVLIRFWLKVLFIGKRPPNTA